MSTVIITKGRVRLVEILLESLEAPRRALGAATEVLLVDDSDPEDAAALQRACERHDCRYVRADSAGVSAKRNQGAAAASLPVVLFLDSDVRATERLLLAHAECYEDPVVHAVLGLVEFDGRATAAWEAVEHTPFTWAFAYPLTHDTVSWGPSANLSFRATSFEALGGFDTGFPQRPGGEDVDLCLRSTTRFGRVKCAPTAKAYHSRDTWNAFQVNLQRFYNWGYADRFLVARHPGHTFLDLPRVPVLVASSVPMALLYAAVGRSPIWLLLPLLLLPLATLLFALPHALGGPREMSRRAMAYQYFFANELGCLRAFADHRELGTSATRLHFGRNQQYGEWVDAGSRVRALLLAWLVLYALLWMASG